MKRCTKCGVEKSLSEFSKNRDHSSGFRIYCKTCCRQYYIENRAVLRERRRLYNVRTKEQRLSYRRGWYSNNLEEINRRRRVYREHHRARLTAYKQKYDKEYLKTPRGKAKNHNNSSKRRARLKKTRVQSFKFIFLLETKQLFYGYCAWCLEGLAEHIDHITPLSKGGPHALSNLIYACAKCNLRKSDTLPEIWAKEIGADLEEILRLAKSVEDKATNVNPR